MREHLAVLFVASHGTGSIIGENLRSLRSPIRRPMFGGELVK